MNERELEVFRRRMWLPATVLVALFSWAVCYGLFVLVADWVGVAASVFWP